MPFQVIDTIRNLTDADIALLKANGITGVSRYIARSSSIGKIMGRAECDRIVASGLALMVNYEQSAGDWQGGAAKGAADGAWARGYVRNVLGLPDSVCIIQSIDTGVSSGQLPVAAAYQQAFNNAGGQGPQGCYGPRNVLEHLHSLGLIRVAWEWMGTAGAPSSPVANIRQYRNKPYSLPFTYDSNTPITPYYGQYIGTGSGEGGGNPPAPITAKGDDVAVAISPNDGDPTGQLATFAWQPGCSIGWITSDTQINVGLVTGALILDSNHKPLKNFGHAEIQDMINRYWAGGPVPPSFSAPPDKSSGSGLDAGTVQQVVRAELDKTKLGT